jgi:hypothetical protein
MLNSRTSSTLAVHFSTSRTRFRLYRTRYILYNIDHSVVGPVHSGRDTILFRRIRSERARLGSRSDNPFFTDGSLIYDATSHGPAPEHRLLKVLNNEILTFSPNDWHRDAGADCSSNVARSDRCRVGRRVSAQKTGLICLK